MTQADRNCPSCQRPIRDDSPRGLCPACLLKVGLAAVEATALHLRCPHCHNPIEVVVETPDADVTCPSCDMHFSVVDQLSDLATQSVDGPARPAIGRFQLRRHLGVGAFGSVWQAHDPLLDRDVAIKIPRRGQLSPAERKKFLGEAQAAAGLKHPGIVSVHEIAEDEDLLYIVSDFVDGPTLAARLQAGPLTVTEAVELCATVADALAHAHRVGVVHRDLKPSNILLDGSGTPHVTDFGLAKREAAEVTMTVDGQILGTPAYMSPEQARGDGRNADGRADVYALGVILFETLTGERPFRGAMRMLLHQVIHDDPPSPRRLNASIPRDLETICLTCLQKDPRRRYSSARELEADLRRFQRHEPIHARPVGAAEKTWRWCQRNPLPATLAALLAVALVGGFGAVTWQWRQAVASRRLAERRADESLQRLVQRNVADGARALEVGDPLAGLTWFVEALRHDPNRDDRANMHRRRIGTIARQLPSLVHVFSHDAPATGAFSSDGRKIVATAGDSVHLWNVESGRPQFPPLRLRHPVQLAHLSPDQKLLVVVASGASDAASADEVSTAGVDPATIASDTSQLAVFDADSGRLVFETQRFARLDAWLVLFSPDSRELIVGAGRAVHWLDALTGKELRPAAEQSLDVRWLALNSDGSRLLVNGGAIETDNEVRLYDTAAGKLLGAPLANQEFADDSPFGGNGRWFVTWPTDFTGGRGSGPSELRIVDASNGATLRTVATPQKSLRVVVAGGGETVCALGQDGFARFWIAATGEPLSDPFSRRLMPNFALDPTGTQVVAQERNSSPLTWFAPAQPWAIRGQFDHDGTIDELKFSPDGKRLFAGIRRRAGGTGEVLSIDLSSGEEFRLSAPNRGSGVGVEVSSDGRYLLTADDAGDLRVWDLARQGPETRPLEDFVDVGAGRMVLSPDQKRLAICQGHRDRDVDRNGAAPFGRLDLFDVESGRRVGKEWQFDARVDDIIFGKASNDAALLLSDGSVALIDLAAGRVIRTIAGEGRRFTASAAADEQRRLVLYVSEAGALGWRLHPELAWIEVRTWDGEATVLSRQDLPPHRLAALSPDGRRCFLVDKHRQAEIVPVEGAAGGAGGSERGGSDGRRSNDGGRGSGGDAAGNRDRARNIPGAEMHRGLGKLHADVRTAEFSRDGERLCLTFDDGVVQLRDGRTGGLAAPTIRGADGARLSDDGRFVAVKFGGAYQVYDARTAEPISLPVVVSGTSTSPRLDAAPVFGPGGDSLLIAAYDRVRVLNLRSDERPASTLSQWSQALSGRRVDDFGGDSRAERVAEIWSSYVASQHVDQRRAGVDERARWHERQTWESERDAALDTNRPHLLREWHGARFHLAQLIASDGRDGEWYRRRGRAALAMREFEAAEKDLSQAIELGARRDPTAWFERGCALAALGRNEAADADVAHAFELGFDERARESGQERERELERWQRRAAAVGLARRLAQKPDDSELRFRVATMYWQVGDYERGRTEFDALLKQGDRRFFTRFRFGDCLAGLLRWDQAVDAYTAALDGREDAHDVLEARAAAHALAGRHSAALADLDKIPPLVTDRLPVLRAKAIVQLMASDGEGYQTTSREAWDFIRSHFGDSPTSVPPEQAAVVVWIGTLGPAGSLDADLLRELAIRAAASAPSNDFDSQLLVAAVAVRAGRAADALTTLEKLADVAEAASRSRATESRETANRATESRATEARASEARASESRGGTRLTATHCAWAAIASRKLGRIDDARRWLKLAVERLEQTPVGPPLLDRAATRLLVDEAKRLVDLEE